MIFEFPELTDERLAQLGHIRPVIYRELPEHPRVALAYIEPVDPREVSFLWDPIVTEPAEHLRCIGIIPTFHSFGHYCLFKPTIAEVLAMIPHTVIDRVAAFLTEGPKHADDLNAQQVVVNAGYHLAQTYLYEKISV